MKLQDGRVRLRRTGFRWIEAVRGLETKPRGQMDALSFVYRKRLLQRMSPLVALHGHAGSHQMCPLLKVDRTCHRATTTAHIGPEAEALRPSGMVTPASPR